MQANSSLYLVKPDLTLLDSARQMNADALIKIFDLYSRPLYNYALRLCSDPIMADTIVGDVFGKLLEHLSSGRGPASNLRSYLYEMAYHLVVDDARYSSREVSLDLVDGFGHDDSSLYIKFENRMLFERVMLAIRKDLTKDQRHVIILRFLEGFSVRETASIIGKDASNVKVIQNRALTKLRSVLEYVVV
jgi:RNA polymerase sigma-70 factor (ECF subfamily)